MGIYKQQDSAEKQPNRLKHISLGSIIILIVIHLLFWWRLEFRSSMFGQYLKASKLL